MSILTDEMIGIWNGPVMGAICTVNSRLEPFYTRVWGATGKAGEATMNCFIPESLSARPLADLKERPRLAINMVDATNFSGYQFKGPFLQSMKATPEEEEYLAGIKANTLHVVSQFFGASAGAGWERYIISPAIRLEIQVEEIYNQAPGMMTAEERKIV
ncbi:MAG: hypothetical protein RH862_19630 [Leptospiraceae bacterium]